MILFSLASTLALADTVTWNQLQPTQISANSWLQSNWNKYEENYHPNYAFDDDAATAWVEGHQGNGEGTQLWWSVSPLTSARVVRLQIRNGYQKSAGLLVANGAPKVVEVSVGTATVRAPLERKMGWQEVLVPIPAGERVERMSLRVVEATPGQAYTDLCISDVKVFVDSDVPYNAAIEASKRADLLAWKKERVDTARAFAALPGDYPFGATTYTPTEEGGVTLATVVAELGDARGALLNLSAIQGPWKRMDVLRAWQAPDRVELDRGLPVRLDDVAFFDAAAELAAKGEGREGRAAETKHDPYKGWWRSNYLVRPIDRGEGVTGTFLYWWYRQIVEERGTDDSTTRHVAWYDAKGRLAWHYETPGAGIEGLTRYTWSDAGKITQVERQYAQDGRFAEYGEDGAYRSVVTASR